ncbi:MAG: SusC/RagA family TonB-linked outer membrane protein [Candidatus Cryptobacteroides sp.]
MKKLEYLIVAVLALLVSTGLFAQNSTRQINGTVKDSAGEPVIGASVIVPNTTVGTSTDVDGRYVLSVPENTRTVEVACIGYSTYTITLGASSVYDVVLSDDSNFLDEVVVVGYGVQKKVNLTGSVSSVSFESESVKSRPMFNATQALAGAMPGLQVMQGSGNPYGEGFSMLIRGTGTLNSSGPLVLVDGMEQGLGNVNPSDIASINVLKDAASCAIYGNRGANGVILITTKNGSATENKAEVTYDLTLSFDQPFKIIHTVSDMATYMELYNESCINIGGAAQYSQSTIDEWLAAKADPMGRADSGYYNYMAYPNTDWWSEIYQNKMMQKHSISASGKGKSMGYNVSMSYINNPGIIENTGYKRYFGRVNVYGMITDWLKVGGRIWGYHTDQDKSNVGSLTSLNTQKMTPDIYPYSESLGLYGGPQAYGQDPQAHNPLWDMNTSRGFTKNTQIFTDWYVNVTFLKHFHWNTDLYYKDYRQEEMSVDNAFGKYDFQNDSYVISPADPSELYSYMYNRRENQVKLTSTLNYLQTFGKHDVAVLVGYEQEHFQYRDFSSTKLGLQDVSVGDLNAVVTPYASGGYGTEYASRSYFGRVNYSYAGKYLFEANFRYDGSSRFAPEYRWGFFPSFSAGWRISEEPWLKETGKVDNLKIRLSWGQLGNNAIGNYDWQSTYGTANYVFGTDDLTNGIAITSIKNYALTWETTTVANVGIDFGFLKNRLTGTIDVYNKLTDGILYTPSMFMVMGNAGAPRQNIAEVTNRGIEFELGWRDNVGKDFTYSVSANVTYNKNWVSKYKGKLQEGWETDPATGEKVWKTNLGDVSTGSTNRVLEGHMINEFYMIDTYKGSGKYWNADGTPDVNGGPVDGMIRTTNDMAWLKAMMEAGYQFYPQQGIGKQKIWYGEYIYADRNGDGLYGNSYDAAFQNRSTTPKVNYGLQASLGWKGIDFSMSWAGAAGFSIYYYRQASNSSNTIYGYAIPQSLVSDRYFFDPKNPDDPRTNINSKNPRLVNLTDSQSSTTSSLHLCKGDYLKLKNLTIGYTLPQDLTRKAKIEKVRVYATGENLFAITQFPGMDPEMRATAGYSTMRQYAFGLNVTF